METEEEKKKRLEAEAAAKAAEEAAKQAAANVTAQQPFATFPDAESFNKRVEREARSLLKAAGLTETDPVKLKAIVDAHTTTLAKQAAAEEAQKSEIQKAMEAKAAAEAAQTAAMSTAEEAQLKAHLYRTFAEHGVKNFDYAFYKVTDALSKLADGAELDEVEFVKTMMADASQAAALGLTVAAPPPKVEGATTTQQGGGPDPKAKEAGGGSAPPADAFSQTAEQFKAATQAKYGFTPM